MIIALDYDGTVTSEPKGFATFVNTMRSLGHKVYIVTMRYPSECFKDPKLCQWAHGVDGVVATSRKAKRPVMEALGLKVGVWIDDNPEAVSMDAVQIWGTVTPENTIIEVDQETGAHNVQRFDQKDVVYTHNQNEMKNKLLTVGSLPCTV